jgi:hypothetical protein
MWLQYAGRLIAPQIRRTYGLLTDPPQVQSGSTSHHLFVTTA